jgi:hypothetical protein
MVEVRVYGCLGAAVMTSVDYRSFCWVVGDRQRVARWRGGRATSATGGSWAVGGVKAKSHEEEEDRQVT